MYVKMVRGQNEDSGNSGKLEWPSIRLRLETAITLMMKFQDQNHFKALDSVGTVLAKQSYSSHIKVTFLSERFWTSF